jgi:large subunit ribosomal protein L9
MKLLLRRSVENVGKIGEIVDVKDGYGRNFLLPQRLAVAVTPANRRQIELEKVEVAKEEAERKSAMERLAHSMDGVEVTITAKAQDDDSLFGSVTAHQIADTLRSARDIHIEVKQLRIAEPIKKLGEHTVEIKLHSEVPNPKVRVVVKREAEEE